MIEGKTLKIEKDQYSTGDEYVLNAKLKDINPMFFGRMSYFPGKKIGPMRQNFTMVRYFLNCSGFFEILM